MSFDLYFSSYPGIQLGPARLFVEGSGFSGIIALSAAAHQTRRFSTSPGGIFSLRLDLETIISGNPERVSLRADSIPDGSRLDMIASAPTFFTGVLSHPVRQAAAQAPQCTVACLHDGRSQTGAGVCIECTHKGITVKLCC